MGEGTLQKQELRDRNNRLVATIITQSNGKLEIRDRNNYLLGTYDPRANETRDRSNRLVAKGNVLSSLVSPF